MRNRFDQELDRLNTELIRMGAMCEEVITLSVHVALDSGKGGEYENTADKLANKVRVVDSGIDRQERVIEDLCMTLLLRQQPVARDLRVVSSALKMISDMERIGDQASEIVALSEFIRNSNVSQKGHIREMSRSVIKMVTDSVDSFVRKDLALAQKVMREDDGVDKLFLKVKRDLIEAIGKDTSVGEECIDLMMVAKYFERIGDHAVNIAEWVVYSLTGERPDNEGDPEE